MSDSWKLEMVEEFLKVLQEFGVSLAELRSSVGLRAALLEVIEKYL
jgi:hypothetical protein